MRISEEFFLALCRLAKEHGVAEVVTVYRSDPGALDPEVELVLFTDRYAVMPSAGWQAQNTLQADGFERGQHADLIREMIPDGA